MQRALHILTGNQTFEIPKMCILGGISTFSDVCARVVKIFHMSIPKIPTSRGVETATTAEGNNLLGFITVIKINSSRRLKYRFGIRSVTFES